MKKIETTRSRKTQNKSGSAEIISALSGSEPSQLLVLGRNGTAKVELMKELALQEIKREERCVVVVDTTGVLSEELIKQFSNNNKMASRLLVIDPTSNEGSPFGFFKFNNEADASRKSETIVDAFRVIYQNQSIVLEGGNQGWTSQTDKILQHSLLLLMYTKNKLNDLPLLLTDYDFRDILLEKLSRRDELSVAFRTSLQDEWSSYRRLARTDNWIEWIEPIIHCTSLLLRPEIFSIFDLSVPWLENPVSEGNVINIQKTKLKKQQDLTLEMLQAKKLVARASVETGPLIHAIEVAMQAAARLEQESDSKSEPKQQSKTAEHILDLEMLIETKKIVLINLSLHALHMDASPVAEAVAALFLASIIGSARNLWVPGKRDYNCAIFSNSYDNLVSPRTITRICRDEDKYRVSLRLCSNTLPVRTQTAVDKLIDDVGNIAAFAVPRSDAELLGSEIYRLSAQTTDKVWQLMKQPPRSFCFYQARTGELTESSI